MNRLWEFSIIASVVALRSISLAADALGQGDLQGGATYVNPLAAISLDHLPVTRDRPLFSPSRRPPVVVTSVPVVAPPIPTAPVVSPPNLVLLGIVSEGGAARALVRTDASATKVVRARLGDDIFGWTVTQIEARRVVLSHDGRSVSYALFEHPGAKAPPPPGTEPPVQNVAQQRSDRRSGR